MSKEEQPEETYGHLDRRQTLLPLLASHTRPEPLALDLDAFRSWDTAQQQEFNDLRLARIVDSIVVPIPKLTEVLKQVRLAAWFAERPVGRTGVFLTGPATMGKTTAAFHAMVEALQRHEKRYPNWRELHHTPVVYVEVSSNSSAKAFMGRLLDYFSIPYRPRTTLEERTQMVMHHLRRGYTSLIVIDEMQNLSKLNNGNFESAQAIKNMLNGVRAVPLYVGMNLEGTALTNGELGAQFAARSTMVKLGPLGFATTSEQNVWRGVIHAFEEQLGLFAHAPTTLFPNAKLLWTLTGGSIGALSRLLTTVALELILAGDPDAETVTPQLLRRIKLDVATERKLDAGEDGAPRAA
ncbi:TniB family NTP-binding protein [Microbacterium invictum]|uniref:AAA+ ATPase domain-containing protein n=1 Tax=Microbacterium invictum TaxID=515415 RepID=A0AA40SQA3_9MICO|nr:MULTISPECIES: TniB family NTP-binding protein [Microbacterium]MBB4140428.1 hypothetical protein [Microbacterium invictum]